MPHLIDLVGVTKQYGDEIILDNINLYIRNGEFLTLLGPSGCGKTTTLRIIAGFTMPTSGDVLMDGKSITALPPYKRRVNTVFQKYVMFPHLNVHDNIAFGLKTGPRKTHPDKKTISHKVAQMLEMVNLSGYENRAVESLSGGQQQRVAIARALINEPEVLLLDEPLGALDLQLRKDMQLELKRMQQSLGITFIYVTHDQEEALTMSDTIVVMNKGVIRQIGTPMDIYNEPRNRFAAKFIGESNIIDGVMLSDYRAFFAGAEHECVDFGFEKDEPVDIVLRPEDVDIVAPEDAKIRGTIESVIFMGVHYAITVDCGEHKFMVHTTDYAAPGSSVGIALLPDAIHVMKKEPEEEPEAEEV